MRVCCFLQEGGEEFVLLSFPPLYDPEASKQQEHQRVQVDFQSAQEEPPDAHRFIIRRDQIGSLELLDSFKPDREEQKVGASTGPAVAWSVSSCVLFRISD